MDDIQNRLNETGAACLSAYENWSKNRGGEDEKENLNEAVHELRKVAARIEIEMAVSERDPKQAKRIPIPEHRDAKKRAKSQDDQQGEAVNDDEATQKVEIKPRRRRTASKAAGE